MTNDPTITVSEKYLHDIKRKLSDYETLINVSSIISSTLKLDDLMNLVMEKAKQELDAEACSILFYNKDTDKLEFEVALCAEDCASDILKKKIVLDMGQGIAGWVAANMKPLVINDVSSDPRFFADADKMTGFTTKSIIAVPLIGRGGLIGVAELINPRKKDYDIEVFNILCGQFAIAIENALFHREVVEQEKLKQELDIAAALQKSFLPELPVFGKGKVLVSAVNIPAEQVGGDLYDFIVPSDDRIGVFIGDVSGKGVSGALYMAKIISDFRYIAMQSDSPEIAFNRLNAMLSNAPRGMFLTAVYIIADANTGELRVAVAGHPPFLRISNDGVYVEDLLGAPPIGIFPVEYPMTIMHLNKGDRLLLFTDGVYEAKNKDGQRIGFDAFVDFVAGNKDEENIIKTVTDYVEKFSEGVARADDITLLEVKWLG